MIKTLFMVDWAMTPSLGELVTTRFMVELVYTKLFFLADPTESPYPKLIPLRKEDPSKQYFLIWIQEYFQSLYFTFIGKTFLRVFHNLNSKVKSASNILSN